MNTPRDLDALLAETLHDEADRHHPRPDWEDVRRRAEGPRRRPWRVPALAAAAVALALFAGLLVGSDRAEDAGVVADDGGPSTQLPDNTSTSTTAPEGSTDATDAGGTFTDGPTSEPLALPAGEALASDEAAAVVSVASDDEFGRSDVVVLSTTTGEVLRTLASGFDSVEGGVYRITLTTDRRTVVYTVATSACTSRIEAVAADGTSAPVTAIEDASAIAFSPDGRQAAVDVGDECLGPVTLDLVPVAGGPTVRYEATGNDAVTTIESMVFASPGAVTYIGTGFAVPGPIHIVDFTQRSATMAVTDGNRRLTDLAHVDGAVTALESCCDETGSASVALATLAGLDVVDRRPLDIDDVRAVAFIGFDRAGRLVLSDSIGLMADGELIAEGVQRIAL